MSASLGSPVDQSCPVDSAPRAPNECTPTRDVQRVVFFFALVFFSTWIWRGQEVVDKLESLDYNIVGWMVFIPPKFTGKVF